MNESLSLRILLCALGWALSACETTPKLPPFALQGTRSREIKSSEAPLTGRWEGRWISAKHRNSSGRLSCEMTPTAPEVYRARFLAQWHIFRTRYEVTLRTHSRNGRVSFEGSHALPALFGGEYRYRGIVKGNFLEARYESSYDSGMWDLKRVLSEAP
jgi:hypothetical protein